MLIFFGHYEFIFGFSLFYFSEYLKIVFRKMLKIKDLKDNQKQS